MPQRSASRVTAKRLIALASLGALVYLISPARSYTLYIAAQPMGDQRFYVVTNSGRGSFHGRDVNRVDERFVLADRETRILLDPAQIQWFGSLSVTVYHPEYFYEIVEVEGGLFSRSATIEPISWSKALSQSPGWALASPPMGERNDAFLSARKAHRLILLSDVHYHLRALSTHYLDLYLRGGVDESLRRSIDEALRIVPLLEAGLRGDPDFTNKNAAFRDEQINEIHASVEDIRSRTSEENR